MHTKQPGERDRSILPPDGSPFRDIYLQGEDDRLWEIILGFLQLANEKLWANAAENSYIRKTVGIQALFDVLRAVAEKTPEQLEESLAETLGHSSKLDFGDNFFQASGKGRVRIRNTILLAAKLITPSDLSDADRQGYLDVVVSGDL